MVRYGGSAWIGVDLDGTLAHQDLNARSFDPDEIGEPIAPMIKRVKQWLANGQTVKIFTARASVPKQIELVKTWLAKNDLPDLEVTNAKDFRMIELWDDRCVQVARNSGQPIHRKDTLTETAESGTGAPHQEKVSIVSKIRMFLTL